MRPKIFFSAFLTFLFAAVSYGQGSPNRLLFRLEPDSSGGQVTTVTYIGLENTNLRIFESFIPASSTTECHSSTNFPNPRIVGPEAASLAFDPATSTYKLRWATTKPQLGTCRVLRVGQSADSPDFAIWQSRFGADPFVAEPIADARPISLSEVTYTYHVTNTSLWGGRASHKE